MESSLDEGTFQVSDSEEEAKIEIVDDDNALQSLAAQFLLKQETKSGISVSEARQLFEGSLSEKTKKKQKSRDAKNSKGEGELPQDSGGKVKEDKKSHKDKTSKSEAKESKQKPTVTSESLPNPPKNAKKLNKIKNSPEEKNEQDKDLHKKVNEVKSSKKSRWRDKLSLWVNQLPYQATEKDIFRHFSSECGQNIVVRLVKDKKKIGKAKFKGVAIIDVADQYSLERGLTLDKSTIRIIKPATRGEKSSVVSRVINVEKCLSREEVQKKKEEKQVVDADIEIGTDDAPGLVSGHDNNDLVLNQLKEGFDQKVKEFMNSVPQEVSQSALNRFIMVSKENNEIVNRNGMMMGMLRRAFREYNLKQGGSEADSEISLRKQKKLMKKQEKAKGQKRKIAIQYSHAGSRNKRNRNS